MLPLWKVVCSSFALKWEFLKEMKSKWVTKPKGTLGFLKLMCLAQSPCRLLAPGQTYCSSFDVQVFKQLYYGWQFQWNACGFFKHLAWTLCFQAPAPSSTWQNEAPFKEMGFTLCANPDLMLCQVRCKLGRGGAWENKSTSQDLGKELLSFLITLDTLGSHSAPLVTVIPKPSAMLSSLIVI